MAERKDGRARQNLEKSGSVVPKSGHTYNPLLRLVKVQISEFHLSLLIQSLQGWGQWPSIFNTLYSWFSGTVRFEDVQYRSQTWMQFAGNELIPLGLYCSFWHLPWNKASGSCSQVHLRQMNMSFMRYGSKWVNRPREPGRSFPIRRKTRFILNL